jgi:CubicO group peptidase (beta-lactamase class C family)
MPFVDLVRTRLIEPLGMRDSTVGVEHTLAPNHVSPHERIDGVHQPIRNKKAMNILPANAVNSTAKDIGRWLLFSLGDGTWDGKRIISAEAMREMQSPQIIIPTTPQMRAARNVHFFAAYGLGWQIMDYRGHPMSWHSGNADGMPVYMCILPAEKIGVAVMLNTGEAPVLHGAIAGRILDSLLGLPPEDLPPPPKAQPPAPSPRVTGTSPSKPLEAYAGVYNDPLYGDLTITEGEGNLVLQFARGEKADLSHWNYDVFRVRWRDRAYEWADTFVTFGLDADGKPRRLDMKLYRDTVEAVRK